MSNKLAIVGGTGAVGRVFIEYLKTHELPIDEIKIVASSRSAGKSIHLNGSDIVVEDIKILIFLQSILLFFQPDQKLLNNLHLLQKSLAALSLIILHVLEKTKSFP
jgi:aspartate-semialdehyde dehydrogenase